MSTNDLLRRDDLPLPASARRVVETYDKVGRCGGLDPPRGRVVAVEQGEGGSEGRGQKRGPEA